MSNGEPSNVSITNVSGSKDVMTADLSVIDYVNIGKLPVIPISFTNSGRGVTSVDFEKILFDFDTGTVDNINSLAEYYRDIANGAKLSGQVASWKTFFWDILEEPNFGNVRDQTYFGRDYILDKDGNITSERKDALAGLLVKEAIKGANSEINFANYDLNKDCYVDMLVIIHAGVGEEYEGNTDLIESRSWKLSNDGYTYGEKNTDKYGYGHETKEPCPTGTADDPNIKVDDYIIVSALKEPYKPYESGETNENVKQTIGVFAREYNKVLFPKLYDENINYSGIGNWGAMGSGLNNKINVEGDSPALMSAWGCVLNLMYLM